MIQIPGLNELRRTGRDYDLARSAYSKSLVTIETVMKAKQAYLEATDAYQRLNPTHR